ncbi:YHYH domain-containing protein [Ensifer sp. WSM1721]|nr:YHYH domain-containing protein [Ensifer sp. WSM1721]
MKLIKHAAAVFILLSSATYVFAHSGGTDENGCHTNHKTGSYHCH